MQLHNHIAYRLLTDKDFILESVETMYPSQFEHAMENGVDSVDENTWTQMRQLYHLMSFEKPESLLHHQYRPG
jgi:hypothetical protein